MNYNKDHLWKQEYLEDLADYLCWSLRHRPTVEELEFRRSITDEEVDRVDFEILCEAAAEGSWPPESEFRCIDFALTLKRLGYDLEK